MKIGKIRIPPVLFLLIILFLGILAGMLFVVLKHENWLLQEGIFNQNFMYRIENIDIDKRAYFFLCFAKRMKSFLLLFLLAFSSINFITNFIFFLVYGFSLGSMLELLVVRYGMQGMGIYLVMTLPQGIFYFCGFILLGCWCLSMEKEASYLRDKKVEKIRKIQNKRELTMAFFLIFSGVLLESFLNFGKIFCSFLMHAN